MRRWLAIFLLATMPLHHSWAAVSVYSSGEGNSQEQHSGHHDHDYQAESTAGSESTPLEANPDCGVCQTCCSAAVSSATDFAPMHGASHHVPWKPVISLSAFPSEPERPNWTDLA